MSWSVVLLIAAGSFAFKAAGTFGLGRLVTSERTIAVARLLPPALLAALIVIQTFTTANGQLTVDARLGGVIAGAVAVRRGASFGVVVVIAAATTAGLRALGV